MADFTIRDGLLALEKECELLRDNWQGEVADLYINNAMAEYSKSLKNIEINLQYLSEIYNETERMLEDASDAIYEHSAKKIKFSR